MDIPVELLFFVVLIVLNAIGGLFGGKKKKGPTGKTLPPVESKRPRRPERVRSSSRLPEEAEREWQRPSPDRDMGGSDAPKAPPREGSSERPWWETPETAPAGRGGPPQQDPWRDDPDPAVRTKEIDPEDLWAVLTGGSVPFPAETPPAKTEPAPEWAQVPTPPVESRGGDVLVPGGAGGAIRDDPRTPRPEPLGDAEVVSLEGESLEETEISSEARHDAFHRKIDRVRVRQRRPSSLERIGLADVDDVRRAIVLAEVLGKPRGLSEG